jgi:hypothetical protein
MSNSSFFAFSSPFSSPRLSRTSSMCTIVKTYTEYQCGASVFSGRSQVSLCILVLALFNSTLTPSRRIAAKAVVLLVTDMQ